MFEWLLEKLIQRTPNCKKMEIVKKLLKNVLDSEDCAISNEDALILIENIVKSKGNKVVDFIIKE